MSRCPQVLNLNTSKDIKVQKWRRTILENDPGLQPWQLAVKNTLAIRA